MALPSNAEIAELLAAESEHVRDRFRNRALRRAARAAFLWREEAADLIEEGTSLTVLPRVGPWIAAEILRLAESVASGDLPTPPSLRAGFLSWTEAMKHSAAFTGTVRGDLQSHTLWSDGHSTVTAMAETAATRGYEYLLLTDHTQGLPIANGMDETRLVQQFAELETVQAATGVRLLRGVEMNIGIAGEGDMPETALAQLHVILGAFHSALRRKEDQTERYLAALRNPWVDVLAHPRCRIYNFRIGLVADWPRVCAEALQLDKAIEIDGYPDRQDVDVELLRIAAETSVRVSLGSDAHHVIDMEFLSFSVGAAGLVGIPPERVINCMPADELIAWAAQHRTLTLR